MKSESMETLKAEVVERLPIAHLVRALGFANIPSPDLSILLLILAHSRNSNIPNGSYRLTTMIEARGIDDSTARRAIKRLNRSGILLTVRRQFPFDEFYIRADWLRNLVRELITAESLDARSAAKQIYTGLQEPGSTRTLEYKRDAKGRRWVSNPAYEGWAW